MKHPKASLCSGILLALTLGFITNTDVVSAEGCHTTRTDKYYLQGERYCRRFCGDSGINCEGPSQPDGCQVCISATVGILHRTIKVGPCEENPSSPWIAPGECVVSEYVVVSGTYSIDEDTCITCPVIEGHPCYDEYLEYMYQITHTGVYQGPVVCCSCP